MRQIATTLLRRTDMLDSTGQAVLRTRPLWCSDHKRHQVQFVGTLDKPGIILAAYKSLKVKSEWHRREVLFPVLLSQLR